MQPNTAATYRDAATHPSGDPRFHLLEAALKRHHFQQDALIEVLHIAQEAFGSLSRDLLFFIARQLQLPPSRVFGVATFYRLFTLHPRGQHHCVVCTGTACYVRGGIDFLPALQARWQIQPDTISDSGEVSLETARCLGACGTAPVVVYDGELCGAQTLDDLLRRWDDWRLHDAADSA